MDNKRYYRRHHNQNKNYYKNKKKKNLILDNNATDEIQNILLYNSENQQVIDNDYEEDVVPRKMSNKKTKLFSNSILKYGVGFAVLLIAIFGTSYSFFNYTKEDSRQADVSSGEVYVKVVEDASNITLNKMYPKTDAEARARNDNYFDFTVKAKNTSTTRSIIYNINIVNGEDVSGKTRIDPQYIKVDLQIKVGQTYNYILEGVSLSDFSFIGVVPINTSSETTKEYRLRIWVGDNLTISDTASGASYTQSQFNNLYATYSVSVDSEDMNTAYNNLSKFVDTTTLIDFGAVSSSSNGEGLYLLPGTENDDFPIYYYRGAVENNNVVFGGFCWKIVRTTDTGGIKMIYNGPTDISGSGDNITYNCGYTRTHQETTKTSISLNQGFYYADDYEILSVAGNIVTYKLKSKNNPITKVPTGDAATVQANVTTIVANYPYTCLNTTADGTCTTLYKIDSYDSSKNAFAYSSLDIAVIGRGAYNTSYKSMSDVGYMSNTKYSYSTGNAPSGSIYGKNVEWNGSSYLVIDDTEHTPSTSTSSDGRHYTCGTAGTTSCSQVRFYYISGYYITLSGGDLIADAIYKMTGNGDQQTATKYADYNINLNSSTVKSKIDTWFRTNLTNEINSNNTDYSVYLEDTVFCNERSFKTTGTANTFDLSGWNGQSYYQGLYFGTLNRWHNSNWYSTSNIPNIAKGKSYYSMRNITNNDCPNQTDRFTVSKTNGNGKLTYPVGMLTADEVILAGARGNGESSNSSYYLYTGESYLLISPHSMIDSAGISIVNSNGDIGNSITHTTIRGIRPVISLKLGVEFEKNGDGTPTNPYIVKYN